MAFKSHQGQNRDFETEYDSTSSTRERAQTKLQFRPETMFLDAAANTDAEEGAFVRICPRHGVVWDGVCVRVRARVCVCVCVCVGGDSKSRLCLPAPGSGEQCDVLSSHAYSIYGPGWVAPLGRGLGGRGYAEQ